MCVDLQEIYPIFSDGLDLTVMMVFLNECHA